MNYLILAPLIGIVVKFVDNIIDEKLKVRRTVTVLLGALYGFLIALVIFKVPQVASVYIAALLGVLLTKKIDHAAHWVGIVSTALFLFYFGIPQVSLVLLALFLLAAMIDEKGNDLADAKKIKGALASFLRYRLLLEVTVLAVTVYTGVWEMFFGVFLFDVGYIFTDKLTKAVA